MALLIMEGFDKHASTADMFDYRHCNERVAGSASFTTGRSGSGQALKINSGLQLEYELNGGSTDTIFIAFAIKFNTMSGDQQIIDTISPENVASLFEIYYRSTEQRFVVARNITTGTYIGFTPFGSVPNNGTWTHVIFKIKLGNSTNGEVYIYINGALVTSVTGVDTIDYGSVTELKKFWFIGNASYDYEIDDLYFGDTSGTDINDQIGDVNIESLLVDGAGSSTQFTPSAGSNYQNIDDPTSPDDDTTYNSSNTSGQKDLFSCGNLSAGASTVHAVQIESVSNRQGPEPQYYTHKILSSATEADSDSIGLEETTYEGQFSIFYDDPNGGGSWTASAVNSMEIGYEIA